MAITVTHAKTNNVADWTQDQLNSVVNGGAAPLPPIGTQLADIVLPSDWNDDHVIEGLDDEYARLDGTNQPFTAAISAPQITATPTGNNTGITANGSGSGVGIDITHSGSGTKLQIGTAGSGDLIDAGVFNVDNAGNLTCEDLVANGDLIKFNVTGTDGWIGYAAGGTTYAGIWLKQASPSFSNYDFLADGTNTFVNAPTNLYFRISNNNKIVLTASTATISVDTTVTGTLTANHYTRVQQFTYFT